MSSRLTIDRATIHRGFDSGALATDGRVLLYKWGAKGTSHYQLEGKPLRLPVLDEAGARACGDRFVFVGHPWAAKTPATTLIIAGKQQRRLTIPRDHAGHFLGIWLDGTTLSIVVSDSFHVVHGIAITEVDVRGARAKAGLVRKVLQLKRHIGKGHAELSLYAVLRAGDRLFALASAGHRRQALLELTPKARAIGSRVLFLIKADQAMFSADGGYAVFHVRGKSTTIVGLDGTPLATVKPPNQKIEYVTSATAGKLAYAIERGAGKRDVIVAETSSWPRSATSVLAEVPTSARVADLPVADARACSPEPTAYKGKAAPPRAWGAVIGWALNADPANKQPVIAHAIVADLIVNFFAVTERRLRLLFNFELRAIQDVAIVAPKKGAIVRAPKGAVRVEITTPSGRTVLVTTPAFAEALAAGVAAARTKKR